MGKAFQPHRDKRQKDYIDCSEYVLSSSPLSQHFCHSFGAPDVQGYWDTGVPHCSQVHNANQQYIM